MKIFLSSSPTSPLSFPNSEERKEINENARRASEQEQSNVFGDPAQYPRLLTAVRFRRETDALISKKAVLVPLAGWILGFTLFLVFVSAAMEAPTGSPSQGNGSSENADSPPQEDPFALPSISPRLLSSFLLFLMFVTIYLVSSLRIVYMLVDRLNRHFDRDRMLRAGVMEYLRERKSSMAERWRVGRLSPEEADRTLLRLRRIDENLRTLSWDEITAEEYEKPMHPFVWMLFSVITFGVAWIYLMYHLSKRLYLHDLAQVRMMLDAQRTIRVFGEKEFVLPVVPTVTERSSFLYIVLGVFTLGLGFIVWMERLIWDGNRHFVNQWYLEDQILRVLTKDQRIRGYVVGEASASLKGGPKGAEAG